MLNCEKLYQVNVFNQPVQKQRTRSNINTVKDIIINKQPRRTFIDDLLFQEIKSPIRDSADLLQEDGLPGKKYIIRANSANRQQSNFNMLCKNQQHKLNKFSVSENPVDMSSRLSDIKQKIQQAANSNQIHKSRELRNQLKSYFEKKKTNQAQTQSQYIRKSNQLNIIDLNKEEMPQVINIPAIQIQPPKKRSTSQQYVYKPQDYNKDDKDLIELMGLGNTVSSKNCKIDQLQYNEIDTQKQINFNPREYSTDKYNLLSNHTDHLLQSSILNVENNNQKSGYLENKRVYTSQLNKSNIALNDQQFQMQNIKSNFQQIGETAPTAFLQSVHDIKLFSTNSNQQLIDQQINQYERIKLINQQYLDQRKQFQYTSLFKSKNKQDSNKQSSSIDNISLKLQNLKDQLKIRKINYLDNQDMEQELTNIQFRQHLLKAEKQNVNSSKSNENVKTESINVIIDEEIQSDNIQQEQNRSLPNINVDTSEVQQQLQHSQNVVDKSTSQSDEAPNAQQMNNQVLIQEAFNRLNKIIQKNAYNQIIENVDIEIGEKQNLEATLKLEEIESTQK